MAKPRPAISGRLFDSRRRSMKRRYQQFKALMDSRDLLRELAAGEPGPVASRAASILEDFPPLNRHGQPRLSPDPFTDAEGGPAERGLTRR